MLLSLWKNRARPRFGSNQWWKNWMKRFLLIPVALGQVRHRASLRRRGAEVDPSAFFSDSRLIEGNLECFSVGANSFVGRAEIAVHAPVRIGANVCINDGAKLLTGSHDISDPAWRTTSAPIVVGDFAWICTNAIVLPGVTIGRGAVIGAGAVVAKDVSDYEIAVGNPIRILEKRRTMDLCYTPTATLALFEAWRGKAAGGSDA